MRHGKDDRTLDIFDVPQPKLAVPGEGNYAAEVSLMVGSLLKGLDRRELAAHMDGMPKTERGVRKLAEREGWEGQRRLASKAIEYPFGWLPPETQAALLARMVGQEEPQPEPVPEQKTGERDGLSASRFSDSQRSVMQARLSFVREIERMSKGVSQQRAVMTLVGLARDGDLPNRWRPQRHWAYRKLGYGGLLTLASATGRLC